MENIWDRSEQMSKHKHIDKICCIIVILALLVTAVFMNAKSSETETAGISEQLYMDKIFTTDTVHSIDVVMDKNDWNDFLENATSEEYVNCTLVIDGETYKNVAIRAKGNTSLTNVASYGNNRYSFKVEFDHYIAGNTYYGLDKLVLNNIIQDNTYMKDYLTYRLMDKMGVDTPLTSYANITINGEEWGLYLALEAVEDAFLTRNYGSDSFGDLYKPESMNRGGGMEVPEGQLPSNINFSTEENQGSRQGPGGMGGMGSDDVCLVYTDDEYSSYSNIFDNAKTTVTDADKDRLISSIKQLNEGENIEEVVNIDEVLRYFVAHNFVVNFDSYTGSIVHNYYLYEEDGLMSMIPWDYNLAFGTFFMGNMGGRNEKSLKNEDNITEAVTSENTATSMVNYPIDTPVYGGDLESRPMIAKLLENEEYLELYHEYFSEFISSYFENGYVDNLIYETINLISPYVEKDATSFCAYEEFLTGAETLKEFCSLRAESISGQLDGTIPATTDGQTEDSNNLVDASSLNLSDMGGMGAGQGGGNMQNMNNQSETSNKEEISSGDDTTSTSASSVIPSAENDTKNNKDQVTEETDTTSGATSMGEENGDTKQNMPDMQAGNMGKMGQPGGQTSQYSKDDFIILGISVLILILAIVFVWRFKRRRG